MTSHGPAQARDFAWWSGLTLADVRAGLDMIRSVWSGWDKLLRYGWSNVWYAKRGELGQATWAFVRT